MRYIPSTYEIIIAVVLAIAGILIAHWVIRGRKKKSGGIKGTT